MDEGIEMMPIEKTSSELSLSLAKDLNTHFSHLKNFIVFIKSRSQLFYCGFHGSGYRGGSGRTRAKEIQSGNGIGSLTKNEQLGQKRPETFMFIRMSPKNMRKK